MCRLYGFRANEPTKVECTLVLAQNALLVQSRADLRGKTHADGWGIATYENSVPHVERRETAAFETLHFGTAAERLFARTVVAHVRRATVSSTGLLNTHPFVYGPWAFAHNGTVRGFHQVGPILERETPPELLRTRRGSTDSELAFCWLLGRMEAAGISVLEPCSDSVQVASVVQQAIRDLADLGDRTGEERPTELNFLLTDGRTMVAARWRNSLHWLVREGVHDCEICGIPHLHHDEQTHYLAAVIASEPITDENWQEVPDGAIVVVSPDLAVELLPPV